MIEKLGGTQVGWDLQPDEIPNKINEIIDYLNAGHWHQSGDSKPLPWPGTSTGQPGTIGTTGHQDNEK